MFMAIIATLFAMVEDDLICLPIHKQALNRGVSDAWQAVLDADNQMGFQHLGLNRGILSVKTDLQGAGFPGQFVAHPVSATGGRARIPGFPSSRSPVRDHRMFNL